MNQSIRMERNISNYLALQQFLFSIRFRENTRRYTNTMRHLEFVKEIESRVKVSLFDDYFSITNIKKIIYNTILFTRTIIARDIKEGIFAPRYSIESH